MSSESVKVFVAVKKRLVAGLRLITVASHYCIISFYCYPTQIRSMLHTTFARVPGQTARRSTTYFCPIARGEIVAISTSPFQRSARGHASQVLSTMRPTKATAMLRRRDLDLGLCLDPGRRLLQQARLLTSLPLALLRCWVMMRLET